MRMRTIISDNDYQSHRLSQGLKLPLWYFAIEKILKVPDDYQGRLQEFGDYSGRPWGYVIAEHSLWTGWVKPSEIPKKLRKSENYEELIYWFLKNPTVQKEFKQRPEIKEVIKWENIFVNV